MRLFTIRGIRLSAERLAALKERGVTPSVIAEVPGQSDEMEDLAVLYTGHAEGALPNGTRVRKTVFLAGDMHPVGAMATVRGSIKDPQMPHYGYFVEWDDAPGLHIFVVGDKIATAG